ncbi:hypothetical protein [Hyalangium gracile]|uniref:hypothetical protein n=1 Tax=Hyalangium gracile TaxID=394092 RepID=UPI001CC97C68|nr:hypothetical protein [Hyalangium gracile]
MGPLPLTDNATRRNIVAQAIANRLPSIARHFQVLTLKHAPFIEAVGALKQRVDPHRVLTSRLLEALGL